MLIPLGLLSLGEIFAGLLFHGALIEAEGAAAFWNGSLVFAEHLAHAAHEVPFWVKWLPLVVMLAGLGLAYRNYIARPGAPAAFVAQFGGLHNFLMHKWYFDELYDFIFVRPAMALGRFFWKRGDEQTIDRFGPHGAAVLVGAGNRLTTRLQSGFVYSYALVMLLGLIGAASWVLWWAA
jgi:NADH-quinone oxidoreductase subunit L